MAAVFWSFSSSSSSSLWVVWEMRGRKEGADGGLPFYTARRRKLILAGGLLGLCV